MRRTRTTRGSFVFNLNDYSARPRSCGLPLNCIEFLNCIKKPRINDVVCVSAHLLSAHAVGTPVAARASVKRHTGVECEAFNALAAIAPCVARKQGVTKHETLRLRLATIATAKLPSPAAIPRRGLRLHCGLRRRCGLRSPAADAAPSIRRGATRCGLRRRCGLRSPALLQLRRGTSGA
jgi:hypothetical protein